MKQNEERNLISYLVQSQIARCNDELVEKERKRMT